MVRVLTDHIARRRFPRIVQVFSAMIRQPWLCDVVRGDTNQGSVMWSVETRTRAEHIPVKTQSLPWFVSSRTILLDAGSHALSRFSSRFARLGSVMWSVETRTRAALMWFVETRTRAMWSVETRTMAEHIPVKTQSLPWFVSSRTILLDAGSHALSRFSPL